MHTLYIVLWILAVICFGLGAFGKFPKVNLISLGLFFGGLVFLIQTISSVA